MPSSTYISGIGDVRVDVYLSELYPDTPEEDLPADILRVLVDVHGVTIPGDDNFGDNYDDITYESVDNIRVVGGIVKGVDFIDLNERLTAWFATPDGQADIFEALDDAAQTYL